jgi:hypothetical protein
MMVSATAENLFCSELTFQTPILNDLLFGFRAPSLLFTNPRDPIKPRDSGDATGAGKLAEEPVGGAKEAAVGSTVKSISRDRRSTAGSHR